MPITNRQRKLRQDHIGSSDMAAILGVDPWRTAYDVWLEKTGKLAEREPTDVMEAGNIFERAVLDHAEKALGPMRRNVPGIRYGTALMANRDAVLQAEPFEPVEAKTAGLFGPVSEHWGEDGSDQVPDRVIIQAHVHLICTETPGQPVDMDPAIPQLCHVPAFIGGRGFAMFEVHRNEKIVGMILEAAEAFWVKNVQTDTPPADSSASLQVVKRAIRQTGKTTEIDPQLVEDWLEARGRASQAEKAAEKAQAQILAAMADADAARAGRFGAVTYYQQTRKAYQCKASTFRVLRHKKNGL